MRASNTSSAKIDPSTPPPSPRVGYLYTGAFTGPVGKRFWHEFAKTHEKNYKVILSKTHLGERDFLTVCSIPPTCEMLMSCYRSHGVALIRDEIYVCEPTVWRYAVEPPSSQHTDSKLRRGDILGPGYRSLVGIFRGWVEVINCKLHVDWLVYEENGVAKRNLFALSFCTTKINKSSPSIEQKRCWRRN